MKLVCIALFGLALLVTSMFGCGRYDWDGMDVARPPFHCVVNDLSAPMIVYAEGRFASEKLGRGPGAIIVRRLEIRRGRIKPGGRMCFRWPWASREGRVVGIAGADSVVGAWFDPWGPR